jgi:zinc transport system substrate-binding protein
VFIVARIFVLFVGFIAAFMTTLPALAQVRVLTSIKPVQLIAAAVQDGVGQPEVLLPPGASPHHYALRPSDVRRVADADLLYWIGPDMEGFLPRVLQTRQKPTVTIQDLPGLRLRHFAEDTHSHAEEASDHDPDPANAARYEDNLKAFEKRLQALDTRLAARVAGIQGKPYFVFHEAFDYFESAYGLKHTGVFAVAAEVQPGAQHVAAMRQRLQEVGKTCVFSEPPMRPKLAQTLTAGLPVTLAELDALGGFDEATATGYETLLGNLADNLAGCLEKL